MILKLLKNLEKESRSKKIPIIGKEKGAWLLKKVILTKPKFILELGTANGYSGIILGSQGAKLITIEKDKNIIQKAIINFKKFKINAEIIQGDGLEEINKLSQKFDIIFIDFSKKDYIKVLEKAIELTKKNGLIIADNITFKNCQEYKKAVLNHKELSTEIIDIKDGLSCSKKL